MTAEQDSLSAFLPSSGGYRDSGLPPLAKATIRRWWDVRHRGAHEMWWLRSSVQDARLWLLLFGPPAVSDYSDVEGLASDGTPL